MMDDIENFWSEDSDLNIVMTWLMNGTGGQTYSILDQFLPRIRIDETKYVYDFADIEGQFDEIIGPDHHFKIDDPELPKRAHSIVNGLNEIVRKINERPQDYFTEAAPKPVPNVSINDVSNPGHAQFDIVVNSGRVGRIVARCWDYLLAEKIRETLVHHFEKCYKVNAEDD
jgi:hypothetical protein